MLTLAIVMAFLPCFQSQAQADPQWSKYVPSLPSGNVPYNYRWEVYGGLAYSHFVAGPDLPQGSNLTGFDVEGARFIRSRWAIAASGRGYYGSTVVDPNPYGITKPGVSEYMFMGGPEYRGPSNEHVSITLHALFGGTYGVFNSDVKDQSGHYVDPQLIGLFKDQPRPGGAFGGSIDLNRRGRWALRISPDATLTDFQSSSGKGGLQAQFAISAGVIYRLGGGLRR